MCVCSQNAWEEVQWERAKAVDASREQRDRARDRARLQREQYRLYGESGTDGPRSILKNGDDSHTRLSTAASTEGADIMRRPITANVKGTVSDTKKTRCNILLRYTKV